MKVADEAREEARAVLKKHVVSYRVVIASKYVKLRADTVPGKL